MNSEDLTQKNARETDGKPTLINKIDRRLSSGVYDLLRLEGDTLLFHRPELHDACIFVTLNNGEHILIPRYGVLVQFIESIGLDLRANFWIRATVENVAGKTRIVARKVQIYKGKEFTF